VIIPAARKSRGALAVVVLAAVVSILFRYVITAVSGGFATILSALIAAALAAVLRPIDVEEEVA